MATENKDSGWERVASYSDVPAASIAQGMLEANGIPAQLMNATLASVYPMTDTWASVDLMVPRKLASVARGLLENGD